MPLFTVPRVDDPRELDAIVKRIFDEHSTTGDSVPRRQYEAIVRGCANGLHRFGFAIIPPDRVPETDTCLGVHVIEVEGYSSSTWEEVAS